MKTVGSFKRAAGSLKSSGIICKRDQKGTKTMKLTIRHAGGGVRYISEVLLGVSMYLYGRKKEKYVRERRGCERTV